MKAIGLMSGTSADGLDVACISANRKDQIKLLAFKTYPYPKTLQKKILKVHHARLSDVALLNFEIAYFFSDCIKRFLKKNRLKPRDMSCIGSHGQTVFHKTSGSKKEWTTLQIGEGSVIAALTGITTVTDFRPKDMALGGEGAPLSPYFHYSFFKNATNLAVHNLGGMSNVTFLLNKGNPREILAFDTGPANCVLDGAMRIFSKGLKNFDKDGKLAASGKIHERLVQKLLKHPYFKKKPPKSCGQEEFGPVFLKKVLRECRGLKKKDIMATLTAFVAQSIFLSYKKFMWSAAHKHKLKEIIFCGGGIHNKTLMSAIRKDFSAYKIKISFFDDYGVSSDAVEACCFALMGLRCLQHKINHIPSATGASRATILGKIIYP
ncbi:MAG TPA: anhydro-N-acetylmuramic acid kinase [Bdellovibrionota bacterium]|nr:anhydro-N-acetylmuramic acid kinase [Bdellovibrionota bacterium]